LIDASRFADRAWRYDHRRLRPSSTEGPHACGSAKVAGKGRVLVPSSRTVTAVRFCDGEFSRAFADADHSDHDIYAAAKRN